MIFENEVLRFKKLGLENSEYVEVNQSYDACI